MRTFQLQDGYRGNAARINPAPVPDRGIYARPDEELQERVRLMQELQEQVIRPAQPMRFNHVNGGVALGELKMKPRKKTLANRYRKKRRNPFA